MSAGETAVTPRPAALDDPLKLELVNRTYFKFIAKKKSLTAAQSFSHIAIHTDS